MIDYLDSGRQITRANWAKRCGAYLLDAVVITCAWMLLALVLAASIGRSDTLVLVAFLLALPLAAVIYGFISGRWRSLGSTAAGIRTVRRTDGSRIGAWLGAWRMLVTVILLPFVVLVWVGAALSGDAPTATGPSKHRKYVVLDTRKSQQLVVRPL